MTRRFELDWLRVILFALLVPHHVAVGFVDWGTEIYGFVNDRVAGDGMTLYIYWSHSWRLPSLFLIAGIGTWFLTAKGTGAAFIASRLARLLVPLLFGMAVVNVFGGYATARMTGDTTPFFPFWWHWLTHPTSGHIQHLWFLLNLAIYTLLCWPLFLWRERLARLSLSPPLILAPLIALSALAVILLKPHAPALTGDAYQFALYLLFFVGGFLIGSQHIAVLDRVRRSVWIILIAAILIFALKVILLTIALLEDIPTGEALAQGGWRPQGLQPPNATLFSAVEAMTAWAWCLAALGLASRFLARPGPLLSKLNRSVFPVYVLHFPVTLVGIAIAAQIDLPWGIEFLALVVLVYLVTWTLWRLADRTGPLSYLVGGKTAAQLVSLPSSKRGG